MFSISHIKQLSWTAVETVDHQNEKLEHKSDVRAF